MCALPIYSAKKAVELKRPLFFIEGERQEMAGRLMLLGGTRIEVSGGEPDLGEVWSCLSEDDFSAGLSG